MTNIYCTKITIAAAPAANPLVGVRRARAGAAASEWAEGQRLMSATGLTGDPYQFSYHGGRGRLSRRFAQNPATLAVCPKQPTGPPRPSSSCPSPIRTTGPAGVKKFGRVAAILQPLKETLLYRSIVVLIVILGSVALCSVVVHACTAKKIQTSTQRYSTINIHIP